MTVRPECDVIQWHLFLNTSKVKSAQTILQRLSKILEVSLETTSMEPYWKDASKMDVRASSSIGSTDKPEVAVFSLMQSVQRLANGFTTSGPQRYEGDRAEMVVLATSGFADAGISWLEASIRNFD